MVNSRLAVAIHILSLIASNPREQVSSDIIAGSVNTNPVVIRRMISMLKKAGILTSRPGVAGASLKRDPADISLLDIYRAVQSQEELFAIHEKPNPDCPVGKRIQSTLDETFHSVQKAMENELASKSLKDILSHLF
ncbi:Rrf2 family transcriptional regulator [Bacillus sonorensis]|uniref:Transcriptional regulator YwnA n=2 Tax=Bacillus sonorensis TaxID=119858 RepID=M5P221_9BACI|nr:MULTISPECIES: Rrf2 family transcriptional regulator [Bacillus]TWK80683.1 putative HTH-type transcriptional regulator YwnA [Bacillus paralicheniformis]ASB87034.1 Putative HTH-type transcriptional regulator YwnA [Bacillus sonorensis]EME73479.1 transcriptional regulator YwnA [Bacillus sonorensis L12]MBG9914454.1 transcriptional regulator [Bacillus sonorensis]MCF7616284.1 Rrf2 family transcriptional regulator [Bacillus sonorensis]